MNPQEVRDNIVVINDVKELENVDFGDLMQAKFWIRSRRRGNRRLLFIDADLDCLLDEEEILESEHAILNDKEDVYYKYKTTFTPASITIILYSPTCQLEVVENNLKLSCDEFRKIMTVGSQIDCIFYKDHERFYEESNLPAWLKSTDKHPNTILLYVTQILSFTSSRPNLSLSETPQANKDEQTTRESQQIENQPQGDDFTHSNDNEHKKQRTKMFVKWLIDRFGKEYLNSGTGVVDIAGGKGALCWELSSINQIKATLIDPRTVHLSGKQKKYLRRNNLTSFSHTQIALSCDPCKDLQTTQGKVIRDLFSNCSIIIGMHPDEATDSILHYANYFHKPFALVPCCVYAELFPNRLVNGNSVLTYAQLLDYLQYHFPNNINEIQRVSLPFQGRNVVLFTNFP